MRLIQLFETALSGGVKAKRKGSVIVVDELWIPPDMRGQGIGPQVYWDWEKKVPTDVKYLKLMPVDYGSGDPVGFWEKLGFRHVSKFWMAKGVNGNEIPEPHALDAAVKEQWGDEEEEGEQDFSQLPSMKQAAAHKPEIVKRVQQRYNEWQQDAEGYDEEVGSGGVCHLFAEIVAEVLNDANFPTWTVSSNHEVHVYCVSQASDGVWEVDIPYCIYETGGGYTWTKIPDVTFENDDIVINQLSPDPADIGQYADVEEGGW